MTVLFLFTKQFTQTFFSNFARVSDKQLKSASDKQAVWWAISKYNLGHLPHKKLELCMLQCEDNIDKNNGHYVHKNFKIC